MSSPLSTFIQAEHPSALAIALTDFDLLGAAIITEAHLIVAGMGVYPPTIPFWDTKGKAAVDGTVLADPATFSYDLAAALCSGFDQNQVPVMVGLKTPPPAGPILPPTTCIPVPAMEPLIRAAFDACVNATKPGMTPAPAGEVNIQKFVKALANFVYQAYV